MANEDPKQDVPEDVTFTNPQEEQTTNISNEPAMEINQAEVTNTPPVNTAVVSSMDTPVNNPKRSFWKKLIPGKITHFIRAHKVLAVVITVLMISASGSAMYFYSRSDKKEASNSRYNAVEVPFKVLTTSPSHEATNVVVHEAIKVVFNRPVDPDEFREHFFITPHVEGVFETGDNNQEVIFKPETHFDQGTTVQFGLSGAVESRDGQRLGADFSSSYTTSIPSDGVLFERMGLITSLDPLPDGEKVTYSLMIGSDVKQATITTYQSDVDLLLSSLVYKQVTEHNYTHPKVLNESISTTGLKPISSKENLKDQDTYEFSGEKGVYLIVATDGEKQLGHVWVVVSDFGVILRQDDQKVVLSVHNFNTSTEGTADISLYNLEGSVKQLSKANVIGTKTINIAMSPQLDIAVARSQSGVAVVPVAIIESLADVRLDNDLSKTSALFGSTDKPTYRPGEKVQFAGFIRTDNDANFTLPNKKSYNFYVARYDGEEPKAEFNVNAGTGGVISGSFIINESYIGQGVQKDYYQIFERSENNAGFDKAIASFTVTNEPQPQYTIDVKLDKTSYMPSDKVTATIKAIKTDNSPLANTKLDIKVYTTNYYEDELTNSHDDPGMEVKELNNSVILDAQGNGTFTLDINKLPAGSSQTITIEASKQETENQIIAGAGAAIVHQGNAKLEFGTTRTSLRPNGTLVARVYAKKLDNAVLGNTQINYQLKLNYYDQNTQKYESKPIAEGETKTDNNGYAEIKQELGAVADNSNLELMVWTTDESNNKVYGSSYYYVSSPSDSLYYTDLQLAALDIYGSEKNVKVGDTVQLTIDATADVKALVTLERGRIYKVEDVALKQGKNTYEIVVTDELAPSFTLAISYFKDGKYFSEGTTFNVAVNDKQGSVEIKPNLQNLTANTPFDLQITTKDRDGKALGSNVVLSIAEENMYRLADPTKRNIFAAFYAPRSRTTNATSSLIGLGSGGGRCGGHGGGWWNYIAPSGTAAVWRPTIKTDTSGISTQNVSLPKGTWRVYVYSMNENTIVSSSTITLNVQ